MEFLLFFFRYEVCLNIFFYCDRCAHISSLIWKNVCNCTLKWQWKAKKSLSTCKRSCFSMDLPFIPSLELCPRTVGEADPIYYHISSMGLLGGEFYYFQRDVDPPRKLFVCSDGKFRFSLSGSPLFNWQVSTDRTDQRFGRSFFVYAAIYFQKMIVLYMSTDR